MDKNGDEEHDAASTSDESAGQEEHYIVAACTVIEQTWKIWTKMKHNAGLGLIHIVPIASNRISIRLRRA